MIRTRQIAELVLIAGGLCLLGKAGWQLGNYAAFQAHPEWYLSQTNVETAHRPEANLARQEKIDFKKPAGFDELKVLGRLEVPRLKMSVLVVEGDGDTQLSFGAGHMSGTAELGKTGNSVVSGHRDSAFWPLREIKPGDKIRVTADKTYTYLVKSARVVSPSDVDVLRNSGEHELTLITCYPFRHLGSAPQRYVVEAVMAQS